MRRRGSSSAATRRTWFASATVSVLVAAAAHIALGGISTGVAATSVPSFDHIFVIVMENHGYDSVVGNPSMPYLNALAAGGALLTSDHAIGHPSLPNYLALTGGSTLGVTSDCDTCYVGSAPNIAADRIEPSGRTWKAYMESMPAACSLSNTSAYAVRHNPFVYYDDIRTNAGECAKDVPYTQLASDLRATATTPGFGWITPNLCDDAHDCSLAAGDAWLAANVPPLLSSPAFTRQHSLLVVTFDEDDGSQGNHVPTVLVGDEVAAGSRSNAAYTHYSLLRTIEAAWSLRPLTANDAAAQPFGGVFTDVPPVTVPATPPPTAAPPVTAPGGGGGRRPGAPHSVWATPNLAAGHTGSLTVHYAPGAAHGARIMRFTATCTSGDGGTPRSAARSGAKPFAIVVTRLSTKKRYSCRVRATSARGAGRASAPSRPVVIGAPAAPTGAHPVRIARGTFKVNFSPGSNNGARVIRYTASCTSARGVDRIKRGGRSPILVTHLTPGRTYRCAITATNRRGTGPASSISHKVRA